MQTEQSVATKQFIITNSIDDSYIIYATEIGNGNLNVYFRDLKGVRSSFVLKKTDLIKAETITLDCNLVYEQDFKKDPVNAVFMLEIAPHICPFEITGTPT